MFFTTDPEKARKKIEEIESRLSSGLAPSRVDTDEEGWQMVEKIEKKIKEQAEKGWL